MSAGLADGTIFAARYRVVRRIAAGGMGAVYEVVHLETDRRRALKVMHPHVLQSADLRERFQREAKVAAHIESDFIVDVFDAGIDEPTQMPFLVMELLKGEELGKRLKRLGSLPPADVVTYLRQTASALDKTHRAQIVHRDLKPENLFLTERDDGPPRIKVLDFGIAKVVAESATASGPTQSIGTPSYMAPEQFNPRAQLTGAADRYAVAMMAYTLLVGTTYWAEEAAAGNVLALAMVAMHGPVEPASARASRRGRPLPPSFDAWFAKAAAADPAQRFASAAEMIDTLAQALEVAPSAPASPLSARGATETLPLGASIEPATVPLSAHLLAPPAVSTLSTGTVPFTTTASSTGSVARPAPPSRVLVIVAVMLAALSVVGTIAFLMRRSGTAPAATAVVVAPPPTETAVVAPVPSVAPSATTTMSASPVASAEPAATGVALVGKPAVAASAPIAPTKAAVPTKGTADAQRKTMWGRD